MNYRAVPRAEPILWVASVSHHDARLAHRITHSTDAEPVAAHEPPPRAAIEDDPDDRTLDSLPEFVTSGGR